MINPRLYGSAPFRVAVIHGGPGAAGEMAEVAEVLSAGRGVLEPLQTARSIRAQVEELKSQLQECADPPLTLIGFSWGAWLSLILAAQYPHLVSRLVLIGCGPIEQKYVHKIMETRLSRLSGAEREEIRCILSTLNGGDGGGGEGEVKKEDRDRALARLGELFSGTDSFDLLASRPREMECNAGIYQAVWSEAAQLRRNGGLMALCKRVKCPVVAIHGDYDPHPANGVHEPLQEALKSFRFILLEDCGHNPWMEKRAKDRLYSILREVLNQV